MIKGLFVVLHVITAAGWFGIALLLTSISRGAAESDDGRLMKIGSKAVGMMTMFIVLTFVFGLAAFLLGGGFAFYSPTYHTSLLLILILVLVQYFVIRTSWMSLETGGGEGARKKIAMGIGIGHLLWIIVLVLMLSRYLMV